jgi:hypothetical protein
LGTHDIKKSFNCVKDAELGEGYKGRSIKVEAAIYLAEPSKKECKQDLKKG